MITMLQNHGKLEPATQVYLFDRANNYAKRKEIDDRTSKETMDDAKEFRELCRTQFISMLQGRAQKKGGEVKKVSGDNQFDAWIRYAAGSSPEVNQQWLRMLAALEEGAIVDCFKKKKDETIEAVMAVRSFLFFLSV